MFINTTNGAKTPEEIAKSLKKYGHLIAICPDIHLNGKRKYYSIKDFDDDRIVEVLFIGEKAVATTYLPAEAERLLARSRTDKLSDQIMFGNF